MELTESAYGQGLLKTQHVEINSKLKIIIQESYRILEKAIRYYKQKTHISFVTYLLHNLHLKW
jgi:hypothetical protein